ncbi:TonB C-terminal domain-containing protein [bacterium]|nr:MAG: TonB C-terminal domain-containing protein [bacterium]
MTTRLAFLEHLELGDDADERAIRRSYARKLKQIDQETDAVGFQSLREAYETALQWVSWKRQQQAQLIRHQPLEFATSGPQKESTEANAQGEEEAVEVAPDDFHPEVEARAVFNDFLTRLAKSSSATGWSSDTLIQSYLNECLDNPRLLSITARDIFEWFVAELLADGWRPGHEALLVAACRVFDWQSDRQRLARFGRVGEVLNRAITERAMFDGQPDEERSRQRNLIARLRDPSPPSYGELIAQMALAEWLMARFPAWLRLITSVENLQRWRELDCQVPSWRRKLSFGAGKGRTRPPSASQSANNGISFRWGVVVLIFVMVRALSSVSSSSPPDSPVGLNGVVSSVIQAPQSRDAVNHDPGLNALALQQSTHPRNSNAQQPSALAFGQDTIAALQAAWAQEIRTRIRSNITIPKGTPGDAQVVFAVVQKLNGEIVGVALKQSSGFKDYDLAIEKAIYKSSPLPKAPHPQVFHRDLLLKFVPREDAIR